MYLLLPYCKVHNNTVNCECFIFSDSLACAKIKHVKIHNYAILMIIRYRVICPKII